MAVQKEAALKSRRRVTEFEADCWARGVPYGGAIGGALTYEFTPTGLGVVTKVRFSGYDEVLDLTEYDSW